MSDEEYESLKKRLIADLWAYIGQTTMSVLMFVLEWAFKALSAASPLLIAWLKKIGYLDQ